MNINELKQRLNQERASANVSLSIPLDVIEDLQAVARHLGFSGHESLMRAYIGQGLRADLERLNRSSGVAELVESLRRHGVGEEVIATALAEVKGSVKAA